MAMLTVDGTAIKDPSSLQWGLQSISSADAGRSEDGTMTVNLVTKKRKLDLAWNGVSSDEAHSIISAFDKEYFDVTYFDPLDNSHVTRNFYHGDITAPVAFWLVGRQYYTNVTLNIIEV